MNIVRNDRGVVLVFVAMGLLLFLLFLGLALDTGWLVYVRTQGQARIDAAALAAAAALVEKDARTREANAETLANTFSDKNLVVNNDVDPANELTPMKYDQKTGDLVALNNWVRDPEPTGPNCNAVRVTASVPAPVFFSGIRNVFGARETGQENITVNAVAYLPCPGTKFTPDGWAHFALQKCSWLAPDFRNSCNQSSDVFDINLQQGSAILMKTTGSPPIKIGDRIPLSSLVDGDEEKFDPYLCATCDPACRVATVPVVDQCVEGTGGGTVVGFATVCFTKVDEPTEKKIKGWLKCEEVALGSSDAGGQCFGTYASNPILIQ
jgi:Flp pilus assembly protein TadG